MKRKQEFFEVEMLKHQTIVANVPRRMYPQERDWTCAVACIRTMLSGFLETVPTEDCLVEQYQLKPGPHYSANIKKYHMLDAYDAVYGCDCKNSTLDMILDYMEQGYFVMLESMINYAHWTVLLGYYPMCENDVERAKLLMYDPYYDEVRLVNADEFLSMWRDGDYENTRIDKDFIAVKLCKG